MADPTYPIRSLLDADFSELEKMVVVGADLAGPDGDATAVAVGVYDPYGIMTMIEVVLGTVAATSTDFGSGYASVRDFDLYGEWAHQPRLRPSRRTAVRTSPRPDPPLPDPEGWMARWDPESADRPVFGERSSFYSGLLPEDVRELLSIVARSRPTWRILTEAEAGLPPVGLLEWPWYGQGATGEVLLSWWREYVRRGVGHQGMMRDGWLSGINYGDS